MARRNPPPPPPDMRARIVVAMRQAAEIIAVHGTRYMPLYIALERDLDNEDMALMAHSRAMKLAGRIPPAPGQEIQGTDGRNIP